MRPRAIIRPNPDYVSRHRDDSRALSGQAHRMHLISCVRATIIREFDLDHLIHIDERFLRSDLEDALSPTLGARNQASQPIGQRLGKPFRRLHTASGQHTCLGFTLFSQGGLYRGTDGRLPDILFPDSTQPYPNAVGCQYDVMRTLHPTSRVRCETRPLALLDLH